MNKLTIDAINLIKTKILSCIRASGGKKVDYSASVVTAANNAGIDPNLALAVMQTESAGNPSAVSPVGAVGLFQLMPSSFPGQNIYDPQTNINLGVGYLAQLLNQYNGDTSLALAAYNAGPGNVNKYGGIPPFQETQNYVTKILAMLGGNSGSTDGVDSSSIDGGNDGTFGGMDLTTMVVIAGVGILGLLLIK